MIRPFAGLALSLALATTITAAAAQPPRTRVVATRDEVRVIFPADTAHAWGWPALPDSARAGAYTWVLHLQTAEGGRTVFLGLNPPDSGARTFPSLQSLVGSTQVLLCPPGPFVYCTHQGLSAFVRQGRVTLRIRGRRLVESLFVLRPGFVRVSYATPAMKYEQRTDSVRVEYRDPQIPRPAAATLAAVERARRQDEANSRSFSRFIAGGEPQYGPLWMSVGDSVPLAIEETACHFDMCATTRTSPADSGWSVADSSVVRLRPFVRDTTRRRRIWDLEPRVYAVALRTGRTVLQVRGIRGATDTIPSRSPAPHGCSAKWW